MKQQKIHGEITEKTLDRNIEIYKEYLESKGFEYKVFNKEEYLKYDYFFDDYYKKIEENDKILVTIYHKSRDRYVIAKREIKHLQSIIFDENSKIKWVMYNQI